MPSSSCAVGCTRCEAVQVSTGQGKAEEMDSSHKKEKMGAKQV